MRSKISPSDRAGATLPLLAISLVALIGIVGLAIDLGFTAMTRAELQNAADAAAMAGTAALLDRDELKGSPNQVAEIAAARAAARTIIRENRAGGKSLDLDLNADITVGYLSNPVRTVTPVVTPTVTPPTAFSPPLLYVPSLISLNLPFITPPTVDSAYRSSNAVTSVAQRTSTRNGSLPLFFSGVLGVAHPEVSVTATATLEDNIRGFQIFPNRPGPSKLLPFAMDVNTYGAMAAGLSSLDLYSYNPDTGVASFADLRVTTLLNNTPGTLTTLLDPSAISFNPSRLANPLSLPLDPALATLLPGDRVKEALLVPLLIPALNLPLLNLPSLTVGNFGPIYIGTATRNNTAEFQRQILYGVSAADLASCPDGKFQLGNNGTLQVNGNSKVEALLMSTLQQIKGQTRIVPLYRATSGMQLLPLLGQDTTYEIVGFGGVVILEILPITTPEVRLGSIVLLPAQTRSLRLLVQPEFVIDGTAIGGGSGLSNGGARTSRFVYRPLTLAR